MRCSPPINTNAGLFLLALILLPPVGTAPDADDPFVAWQFNVDELEIND